MLQHPLPHVQFNGAKRMKYKNFTILFLILLPICIAMGEQLVNLDFEPPSTLKPHSASGDFRMYWLLRDADPDYTFDFIVDTLQSDPNGVPQLKEGAGLNSSYGLDIFIEPTEILPVSDRDRFEMRPVHGEGDLALQFGQIRYFGYAIYIDPANPIPTEWTHISQCWQRPVVDLETSNVSVVPMWMSLVEYEGGFGWTIKLKNEGVPLGDGTYPGQSTLVATGPFNYGWNTVIMRLEPQHRYSSEQANFTVWINETREEYPTAHSSYPWGTTPDTDLPPSTLLTGMTDRFDVRCGVYRLKQNVSLNLVFDNVRYGTAFDDVIPTCKVHPIDLNNDCMINIQDFVVMAAQWQLCTDPDNTACVETLRAMVD